MTECYPYVNPWVPAVGAPEGCASPMPGRGWTGSIIYPLEHHRDIHPGFGFRQGHPALDFDVPTGTPVRAAATGSVIWAGPNTWGYGNLVILDHGGRFRTLYAHLDTVLARCSSVVVAGTPIGTAGTTGQASFEHVHFEVRVSRTVGGKTQWWSCNPHLWLDGSGEDVPDPGPPNEEEEDEMTNLLVNSGFEADWGEEESHRCLVFSESGLIEKDVGNIFTPPGWTTWFRHVPDLWDQPEARDVRKHHDPNRIHSGEKAMLLFTFGRRHDAGFLQVVDVEPGQRLRFTAWGHSWSNHILPGHEDCYEDGRCSCGVGTGPGFWWEDEVPSLNQDHWDNARQNFLLAVGIDPTGGTDPYSVTVVWGRAAYIYNTYAQLTVEATAEMHLATIFLRSTTQWPFKHNDAYWDDADLTVVDDGDDPPPPPQDCPGLPRIDYKRTLVLLPPEAGAAWARAVVDGSWDKHRYTISGSADDAGIGALTSRDVIAVNPDEWPGELSLKQFFEMYYPGIHYTAIVASTPDELREALSAPFDPGSPDPPPPIPPRVTRGHLGGHFQAMIPGWRSLMPRMLASREVRALREEMAGFMTTAHPSCIKVLASLEDVKGAARACPDTLRVWRHVQDDLGGIFPSPNPREGARRFIRQFESGLYQACNEMAQEFPHMPEPYFGVESWNEIYNSDYSIVSQAAVADMAFCMEMAALDLPVWSVVFTAAVGNPHHLGKQYELLVPLAHVVEDLGDWFGYHAYWLASQEHGGPDHLWKYLAGRWTEIDKVLCAGGAHVRWFFGEMGAVGGESGHHPDGSGWVSLNAGAGWKHSECYNGNWPRYLDDLMRWDELVAEWNVAHEDRAVGGTIFTSGPKYCGWPWFQVQAQELRDIAARLLARYPM